MKSKMWPQSTPVLYTLFSIACLHLVQSAPTASKTSVYTELVNVTTKKCPYLKLDKIVFSHRLDSLHECLDVNATRNAKISKINIVALQCNIFYDTWNALCDNNNLSNATDLTASLTLNISTDVQTVCTYLVDFYKGFNDSSPLSQFNEQQCNETCVEMDNRVFDECILGASFVRVNGIVPVKPKVTEKSEISEGVQNANNTLSTDKHVENNTNSNIIQDSVKTSSPTTSGVVVNSDNNANLDKNDTNHKIIISESDRNTNKDLKIKKVNPVKLEVLIKPTTKTFKPTDAIAVQQKISVASKTNISPLYGSEYDESPKDEEEVEEPENSKVELSDKPITESHKSREKPVVTHDDEDVAGALTNDDLPKDDSYFFSYFMFFCIVFVIGYVGYHNKQKVLALVLEGRRGRRPQRRRPNTANYHKLDSNLEEAVNSSCDKTTTNVIY